MRQILNGSDYLEIEYSLRLETVGSYTYVGKAKVGSHDSSSVWQIKRIEDTTSMAITFANGDVKFNNSWNLRNILVYL